MKPLSSDRSDRSDNNSLDIKSSISAIFVAGYLESGFHMIAELFFLSDCSDRGDHMETELNLSQ